MKALILEDNHAEAMKAANALSKVGYEVTTLDNGDYAIQLSKRNKFDLYVLDYDLGVGKITGYKVAEILRAEGDKTPIIMNSSGNIPQEKLDAISATSSEKNKYKLEALAAKHAGIKTYNNLLPHQAFLEYSLNALHESLTPEGFETAERFFSQLEVMVHTEKMKELVVKDVGLAREIFNGMKKTYKPGDNPFEEKYVQTLRGLRDTLFAAHKKLEEN